jgi:hypothetical protein
MQHSDVRSAVNMEQQHAPTLQVVSAEPEALAPLPSREMSMLVQQSWNLESSSRRYWQRHFLFFSGAAIFVVLQIADAFFQEQAFYYSKGKPLK